MSHLLLVRHSNSAVVESRPASQWNLSPVGRQRARLLAPELRPYSPAAIYFSQEPKAYETAQIIAEELELAPASAENLHEHLRESVGWSTALEFEESVRRFFEVPGEMVFGEETADETEERFTGAVFSLVSRHQGETIAVVSHGTVMTLFVCAHNELDPFAFWSSLEMPYLVVLSLPDYKLRAVSTI